MAGSSTTSTHGLDLSVSNQLLQTMQSDHRNQMNELSEMHKSDMDAMRADHESSDKKFAQMFSDITSFMRGTVGNMTQCMEQCQQMTAMTSQSFMGQMGKMIPQLL